jgi:hypothetical protein
VPKRTLALGLFVAAVFVAGLAELGAQAAANKTPQRMPNDWPLSLANVLPSGQPVIPIFESWYPNPDGTIAFSFGFINLNSEEAVHIPLGPDNFIEPKKFDGFQPTYFEVAPKERARFARHQSVFIVTVPKDFKGDVVWSLRVRGQVYSSPARATREEYGIEDLESLTEAPVAAVLKHPASGLSGRGRNAFVAGPLKAAVGKPVPLNIGIDLLSRPSSIVTWYHHQGPGKVTFDPKQVVVKAGGDVNATATFSQPGDYVLRVTALESLAALEQHCCYTNGYVKVTVTR